MKTVRREPEANIKNRLVEHYKLERLPMSRLAGVRLDVPQMR
jgi:hypothetical protein